MTEVGISTCTKAFQLKFRFSLLETYCSRGGGEINGKLFLNSVSAKYNENELYINIIITINIRTVGVQGDPISVSARNILS